ncbi:afli avfa cytochrome p450 monooxygenase [Colletotrichum truncatum]|uniref:Afli avfa cytochrome p450 monooxygenase n=1 Tax=Colletotrichum truncatum TaxID=5467 RepID=A0ACC3YQ92_COLTU|nr:afli avfa cytochrome p450 monooxygenase [Colletotrichum truncatum]KAF6796646.1 afli avfa cytochrome p450 monooxygenase [Colletotrichum truncatum]
MPSTASSPQKTLAIFGATGGTGSETLKCLLKNPSSPFHLKIYVRSKPKLLSLFPSLKTNEYVEIIEGQVTDTSNVKDCLEGADTIICALGENDNRPGVRVLTDASRTIVNALKQLKDNSTASIWQKPRLILLSSATWNKRHEGQQPALVSWLIKNAFYYPYADLLNAHATFNEAEEEGLMSLLLVQPPAIIDEGPSGYKIGVEGIQLAVSYPDLGAAFAELATDERYKELDAVGVWSENSREGFRRYGPEILTRLVKGLLASYVPGFWRVNGWMSKVFG